MPVFVVALPRFEERYDHITRHMAERFDRPVEIIGVDGRETDPALCIADPPLTAGQIGCALSHVTICRRIVELDLSSAFVVEDDVILPENIEAILAEAETLLGDGEIIQLYNWSHHGSEFSSVGTKPLAGGLLYFPTSMRSLGTTGAYIISRRAAEGILRVNYPVRATADNWEFFFDQGAVITGRAMIPSPIRLKAFETTVLPGADRSRLKTVLARTARLPLFRPLLEARRRLIVAGRGNGAMLTEQPSSLPLAMPLTAGV